MVAGNQNYERSSRGTPPMNSDPTIDAPGVASHALFALAAGWDAESKRLFEEAKNKWHMSDHLDLEHQAKVFRRCSSDLQKLIRANVPAHPRDHE